MSPTGSPSPATTSAEANGAIWAALLASGIGAFAMGLVVILNESGLFVAPTLYAPAGGVSGRTTIAAIVWLLSWILLHRRWRDHELESGRITVATVVLIALGVLGTFPPVWALL
jgi:hypothetical protein